MVPATLAAQTTAPTIDTDNAELGRVTVGTGAFHTVFGANLSNGDFTRGAYDDDAANLHRLPAHVEPGFNYAIGRGADGAADAWLVATSSNGFHAPAHYETGHPRSWYESNNLVGVVAEPAKGWRLGAAYTIKTNPNGVGDTSHELSVTTEYQAERGWGRLHPHFELTIHPQGGVGTFTRVGVTPSLPLRHGDDAPTLALPLAFGVGWGGFYQAGTGDRAYGSAGLNLAQPFRLGAAHARLQLSALALFRDDTLAHLGVADTDAETSTVVPLVTFGLTIAL